MHTKYGGNVCYSAPHRPGPDNPLVNHAQFATVADCQDRIYEIQALLTDPISRGAVRELLEQQVTLMEGLVKDAWRTFRLKGR